MAKLAEYGIGMTDIGKVIFFAGKLSPCFLNLDVIQTSQCSLSFAH